MSNSFLAKQRNPYWPDIHLFARFMYTASFKFFILLQGKYLKFMLEKKCDLPPPSLLILEDCIAEEGHKIDHMKRYGNYNSGNNNEINSVKKS